MMQAMLVELAATRASLRGEAERREWLRTKACIDGTCHQNCPGRHRKAVYTANGRAVWRCCWCRDGKSTHCGATRILLQRPCHCGGRECPKRDSPKPQCPLADSGHPPLPAYLQIHLVVARNRRSALKHEAAGRAIAAGAAAAEAAAAMAAARVAKVDSALRYMEVEFLKETIAAKKRAKERRIAAEERRLAIAVAQAAQGRAWKGYAGLA